MKCVVNWIPLGIRVRSRNTQPYLKANKDYFSYEFGASGPKNGPNLTLKFP